MTNRIVRAAEKENHPHCCSVRRQRRTKPIGPEFYGEFVFMSDISELFMRCVEMHKAGEHAIAAQGYAAILP